MTFYSIKNILFGNLKKIFIFLDIKKFILIICFKKGYDIGKNKWNVRPNNKII